jgi:hypothetical protein
MEPKISQQYGRDSPVKVVEGVDMIKFGVYVKIRWSLCVLN